MKKLITICAIICSLWSASGSPVLANWTGDSLTGVLNFGGWGGINFFDPANGYVPAGSSGIQPNAVVSDTDGSFVEFMFLENIYSGINVDVDATSISVTQFPTTVDNGANSWDVYIGGFDPDVTNLSLVSNTMMGLSWELLNGGDTLHFSKAYFERGSSMGQVTLNLAANVIPAPGAILLGGIGVAFVGWLRRRRTL